MERLVKDVVLADPAHEEREEEDEPPSQIKQDGSERNGPC